jgi:ATP-dependent helicase/nuclease subunit A
MGIAQGEADTVLEVLLPELALQSKQALREIVAAPITTMHSFANEVLRDFPIEAGVPPQFEIMTDDENASLLSRVVTEHLEHRLADRGQSQRLLSTFEKFGGRAGLVAAIDKVLKKLAEEGLRGSDIFVRPNPRNAAHVLQESIAALENLLWLDPSLLWKGKVKAERIAQIDAAQAELLEAKKIAAELIPLVETLEKSGTDEANIERAVESAPPKVVEFERLATHLKAAYGPFARCTTDHAQVAKNAIRKALGIDDESPGEAFRALAVSAPFLALSHTLGVYLRDIVLHAEETIQTERRKLGALTFSDLMLAARDLLRDNPDIQIELSSKYKAILVDEFQDTNRVQRDLIYYLHQREEEAKHRKPGDPVFESQLRKAGLLIVGDRKQSIYGFRGADIAVFQNVCASLCGSDAIHRLAISPDLLSSPPNTDTPSLAKLVTLSINRRSKARLLEAFNIIANEDLRFNDMEPGMAALPKLEQLTFCDDEKLVPPPDSVDSIASPRTHVVRTYETDSEAELPFSLSQAIVVARLIQGLGLGSIEVMAARKDSPKTFWPTSIKRKEVSFRNIAVLVRSYAVARPLAAMLDELSIPFVYGGKGGLYTSSEASDLCSVAGLLMDSADGIAFVNALRGPWASITDASLLAIATDYSPKSPRLPSYQFLRERLRKPIDDSPLRIIPRFEKERLLYFLDSLDFVQRHLHRLGCAGGLQLLIEATRFEESLAALPRTDQRIANLRAIIDDIQVRALDLRSFIKTVRDAAEGGDIDTPRPQDPDDEAVRIMTIHGSKGLEFPVVILMQAKSKIRVSAGLPRFARSPRGLELSLSSGAQASGSEISALEKAREWAERQRLSYVALTRARDELFIAGCPMEDKSIPKESLYASLLRALPSLKEQGLADEILISPVLPPSQKLQQVFPTQSSESALSELNKLREPVLAPKRGDRTTESNALLVVTPLADYAICPRRFELAHVLGIDEHAGANDRNALAVDESAKLLGDVDTPAEDSFPIVMDARGKGTLLHAALERFAVTHWASAESARRWLASRDDPKIADEIMGAISAIEPEVHSHVRFRLSNWTTSEQARKIGERIACGNGDIRVEEAFVVPLGESGPYLKGTMDLVVLQVDGQKIVERVHVIDYKSGRRRSSSEARLGPYPIQMAAYRHAAKRLWPTASRCDASLVFLGGAQCDTVTADAEVDLLSISRLIAEDRSSGKYRALENRIDCESHHCGYVEMCHGPRKIGAEDREGD